MQSKRSITWDGRETKKHRCVQRRDHMTGETLCSVDVAATHKCFEGLQMVRHGGRVGYTAYRSTVDRRRREDDRRHSPGVDGRRRRGDEDAYLARSLIFLRLRFKRLMRYKKEKGQHEK